MNKTSLRIWSVLWVVIFFIISGCSPYTPASTPAPSNAPATTETVTPVQAPASQVNTTILVPMTEDDPIAPPYPNLWTRINKDEITIFPYDVISDFTYAGDGSLWMVGGFGILHRLPDGEQTVYSIKNGLTRQLFTRIAISPSGEVWAGGTNNALFRFDGSQWIDEGQKLPLPNDDRKGWLCYSQNISGIDFDENGSIWVMNSGVELYTQAYGQWVNFPFPKEWLPIAGGGGCPIGLRVLTSDDISVMHYGCCDGPPVVYHFNGKLWARTEDLSAVETLLLERHIVGFHNSYSYLHYDDPRFTGHLSAWRENALPPDLYSILYAICDITSDANGIVWLNGRATIYRYASGKFNSVQQILPDGKTERWMEFPDISKSMFIDFGAEKYFYQEEKDELWLTDLFYDLGLDFNCKDVVLTAAAGENDLWVFSAKEGLLLLEDGLIKTRIEDIPAALAASPVDGMVVLQDGRIWIGGRGQIWEYQQGVWNQYFIPNMSDMIIGFVEDGYGGIYAATDTAVYRIENGKFTVKQFVTQHRRTTVASDVENEGINCAFHKHYSTCLISQIDYSPESIYQYVYLGVQADGAVVYINNRVIAKFEDGIWKSFFFDTFEINSATVDQDGNIWLMSESDGLFKLSPDVFDDVQL